MLLRSKGTRASTSFFFRYAEPPECFALAKPIQGFKSRRKQEKRPIR